MVEKGVGLNSVDVVAPLENVTANALVASEGASLLVGGLNEKGLGFDANEGAAAEPVGLNNGVEVVASTPLLVLCWLAKKPEVDAEEAGLKEPTLDLGRESVLGWAESGDQVVVEGLKVGN